MILTLPKAGGNFEKFKTSMCGHGMQGMQQYINFTDSSVAVLWRLMSLSTARVMVGQSLNLTSYGS